MDYINSYHALKSGINLSADLFEIGNLTIKKHTFVSSAYEVIMGHPAYSCDLHGLHFDDPEIKTGDAVHKDELIDTVDSLIEENHSFRYKIFCPDKSRKNQQLIFLFHGFNEKNWDKYYPWAMRIAETTGKAVILFPIAFHMNRTPDLWVNKRMMFSLSEERKKKYPNIIKSSLSNAAISVRLHAHPQRFIWSGLQTYYDVIHFVENCREGLYEDIDKNCSFDFFSYSIGSLLAEILKLTNYRGYFTNSKLCMFCGGAVFSRLSPVSKFILDSEANVALYSFLVEHINSHLKHDPRLLHYLGPDHPEGMNLFSMLDFRVNLEYREDLFRKIQDQVLAVTLKQDKVIPYYEVLNTLQGINRDISIPVEVVDLPYPYIHEDPFPVISSDPEKVNEAFNLVFDKICGFLK